MLTPTQLVALETDEDFLQETDVGLKKAFGDLCREVKMLRISEKGVRDYISAVNNTRERRHEFAEICVRVLLRQLNAHSTWRCTAQSVQVLFDSESANAAWLAYEVPHVKAVLSKVECMLTSHRIQAAVSRVSGIAEDQVVGEMFAMSLEIQEAKESVIQDIENRHVLRTMGETVLNRLVRRNDPDSLRAMILRLSGGSLGVTDPPVVACARPNGELPEPEEAADEGQ